MDILPEELICFKNILKIGINENNYNIIINGKEYNVFPKEIQNFWLTYFKVGTQLYIREIPCKYGPIMIEVKCKELTKDNLFKIYDCLYDGVIKIIKHDFNYENMDTLLFHKSKERIILFYFYKIHTNRRKASKKIINYFLDSTIDKDNILSIHFPESIELFHQNNGFLYLNRIKKVSEFLKDPVIELVHECPSWNEFSDDIFKKYEKRNILERLKDKYKSTEKFFFPYIFSLFVNERPILELKSTFLDFTKYRENDVKKFYCDDIKTVLGETCAIYENSISKINCEEITSTDPVKISKNNKKKLKLINTKDNFMDKHCKLGRAIELVRYEEFIDRQFSEKPGMSFNVIVCDSFVKYVNNNNSGNFNVINPEEYFNRTDTRNQFSSNHSPGVIEEVSDNEIANVSHDDHELVVSNESQPVSENQNIESHIEGNTTTKQTIKIQKRNLMVDFFTNNIIEDKKNILDETVLYNFFCDWLKDKTQDVPNKKSFNAFLKSILCYDIKIDYSLITDKKTKKRFYHGIKIK